MIDEKKLKEEIESLKVFITGLRAGKGVLSDYAKHYKESVLRIINEQPKTDCSECSRRKFYQQGYQDGLNADKWIPCDERLPDIEKKVLVTIWYHRVEQGFLSRKGKWFVIADDGINEATVIAWKPLPEPYKKEGAE